MAGERRKARAIALQALYEVDCTRHEADETVGRLLAETGLTGENAAFSRALVSGVVRNEAEIDDKIQALAAAWPVEQIARIDRNIIRLAIFEILLDNKVPVKVAINEAVELAKRFGSESSAKFVNGVLGSVSELARR